MITMTSRKGYLRVDYSNGEYDHTENPTPELVSWVQENLESEDEEKFKKELRQKLGIKGTRNVKKLIEENSKLLTIRGMSCYMLSVSQLSIPEDFAEKIVEAEMEDNQEEIQKYKNFWTLVSLNPDERVRNNIFWFIRKWDMKISNAGFIIGYRNVDIKSEEKYTKGDVRNILNAYYNAIYIDKTDPSSLTYTLSNGITAQVENAYNDIVNNGNSPIFTDCHSHTFTIKLGEPVSMPREQCDAEQENSCSRGLHVGALGWLKSNYFGSVGLQVLVNPTNVVAIPTIDSYGKMRCCEYLPVCIIDYDDNGNVIEPKINMHSDVNYLKTIKDLYKGEVNNNDIDNYVICHSYKNREEMYDDILKRLTND